MVILQVLLTTLGSVAVLFVLCRLTGPRQISEMNMFDYLNSITIGSIAAELATNLEEWYKPLTAMVIYGLCTFLIDWGSNKSLKLRKFVCGTPVVLWEGGKLYRANFSKTRVSLDEFLTQCRIAGYFDLSQLEAVVMENNGKFSFLPAAPYRPATPQDLSVQVAAESLRNNLIFDGQLLENNLKSAGYDKTWLMNQLHTFDIHSIEETFLAYCDESGSFFACKMVNEPCTKRIFE